LIIEWPVVNARVKVNSDVRRRYHDVFRSPLAYPFAICGISVSHAGCNGYAVGLYSLFFSAPRCVRPTPAVGQAHAADNLPCTTISHCHAYLRPAELDLNRPTSPPRLLHLRRDPRIGQRDALLDRHLGAPAERVDAACWRRLRLSTPTGPFIHSTSIRLPVASGAQQHKEPPDHSHLDATLRAPGGQPGSASHVFSATDDVTCAGRDSGLDYHIVPATAPTANDFRHRQATPPGKPGPSRKGWEQFLCQIAHLAKPDIRHYRE